MKFLLRWFLLGVISASPLLRATEFLRDTFTDTEGTTLVAHTGEIGATWTGTLATTWEGGVVRNNRLTAAATSAWGHRMYASAPAPSAEYDVNFVLHIGTSVSDGGLAVYARWSPATNSGYGLSIYSGTINLERYAGGGATWLGNYGVSWVPETDYTIRLEIRNAAKKVYLNGVLVITTTDNVATDPGVVGLVMNQGDGTTGYQIDSISAEDFSSGPPVPVVTSAASAVAPVGNPFTYTITGTNTPTSFSATGLPGWLTLNSTTGVLQGTPPAVGTVNATVTAINAGGSSNPQPLTISLNAGPTNEFFRDTFTDTEGTTLVAHTGEIGATWTGTPTTTWEGGVVRNNRLTAAATSAWGHRMYASAPAPSAEYDVNFVLHIGTSVSDGGFAVYARWSPATNSGYGLSIYGGTINLERYAGGGATWLGNYGITWVPGTDYTIRLEIRNATKKVYVNGVLIITTTDNVTTDPGAVGVVMNRGDGTTGFQIDSISAVDYSAPALLILSGNNQTTPAGQFNPQPFDIAVLDALATRPLANAAVTFSVQSGGGKLATTNVGSPTLSDNLTLFSDLDGTVQAYYKQPATSGVSSQINVTVGLSQLTLASTSSSSGGSPDDSDGNGLPDAWENFYFGTIGVNPLADPDGDGVSTLLEFLTGRDPTRGAVPDTTGAVNLRLFSPTR